MKTPIRRRRLVLTALVVQCVVLGGIGLVALDLFAHKRVESVAGLNMWGYRGEVAAQKQPREIRIAVIGGTRAFGLGLAATWTTTTVLRQYVRLATDRPGYELRPVVALNLARVSALPDSYLSTITHYAYLKPDYLCIYDDLGVGGEPSFEKTSGIYAATGYMPMLPLVLREKAMAWKFGDVVAGYRAERSLIEGRWFKRSAGVALDVSGRALGAFDRTFARVVANQRVDWSGAVSPNLYAATLMNAVGYAAEHARGVVLVVSPAETARQSANLAALMPLIYARLPQHPSVRFISLNDIPTLRDPALRLDEWNFGGDATEVVAKRIAPAMIELINANAPEIPSRQ